MPRRWAWESSNPGTTVRPAQVPDARRAGRRGRPSPRRSPRRGCGSRGWRPPRREAAPDPRCAPRRSSGSGRRSPRPAAGWADHASTVKTDEATRHGASRIARSISSAREARQPRRVRLLRLRGLQRRGGAVRAAAGDRPVGPRPGRTAAEDPGPLHPGRPPGEAAGDPRERHARGPAGPLRHRPPVVLASGPVEASGLERRRWRSALASLVAGAGRRPALGPAHVLPGRLQPVGRVGRLPLPGEGAGSALRASHRERLVRRPGARDRARHARGQARDAAGGAGGGGGADPRRPRRAAPTPRRRGGRRRPRPGVAHGRPRRRRPQPRRGGDLPELLPAGATSPRATTPTRAGRASGPPARTWRAPSTSRGAPAARPSRGPAGGLDPRGAAAR